MALPTPNACLSFMMEKLVAAEKEVFSRREEWLRGMAAVQPLRSLHPHADVRSGMLSVPHQADARPMPYAIVCNMMQCPSDSLLDEKYLLWSMLS
ncbi:MAG: hypothetical protein R3D03_11660 [Geminicoccaceae bacterium]